MVSFQTLLDAGAPMVTSGLDTEVTEGNICIQLSPDRTPIKLHRCVLNRYKGFAELFASHAEFCTVAQMQDHQKDCEGPHSFSFTLQPAGKNLRYALKAKTWTPILSKLGHPDVGPIRAPIKIRIRQHNQKQNSKRKIILGANASEPSTQSSMHDADPTFRLYRQAHLRLFLILYDLYMPLAENIDDALDRVEVIARLAQHYGCLSKAQHQLNARLWDFAKTLYQDIAKQPVRWLNTAILLQNSAIYFEAMTHCVGGFFTQKLQSELTNLNPELRPLVFHKAMQLRTRQQTVELQLFSAGTEDGPDELTSGARLGIYLFRDFLATAQRAMQTDPAFDVLQHYRALATGGDAYLNKSEISTLMAGTSDEERQNAWEALEELKQRARECVAPLAQNALSIDPVETGIVYLVCTETAPAELPWR